MPQIKEYNRQNSGPGVVNPTLIQGSDISGGAGKNLQVLAGAMDNVNDYMAKEEKQRQDFDTQKTKIKETLDLNEYMQTMKMKAPAGADGFADQAKQELDKRKQKLLDSAGSDYMRQKLDLELTSVHGQAFNEAIQFESESRAKKDKSDVQESLFRTKNAVRMNPALTAQMIEETNKLIDTTRIDSTTKEIWKKQELQDIRQNEIRGWIDINPVKAKEMIQGGTWDKELSDDLRNTLLHESNQGIRALDIEKNRSKDVQDKLLDAEREERKDDYLARMVSGTLSANEVVRDDKLKAADKEHILREMNSSTFNVASRTDPGIYNNVYSQIVDGKITSDTEIMKYLGKGLKASDVQHLRRELNSGGDNSEKVFKKGMDDIAKGMLTKSNGLGFKDPEGDTQLQKWRVYFSEEYTKGKASGLSAKQMLDPDSKDYIGKDLQKFVRTQDQVMKSVLGRVPVGSKAETKVLKPWEKAKETK